MRPLEIILKRLEGVRESNGAYGALCPAHDDNKPSLSVREGDDGKVLLKCFAGCNAAEITDAIGLTLQDLFPESPNGQRNGKARGKIIETYDYHDAEGRLHFQTVRYEPKDFRQRRPNGNGGWISNLKGVEPVLYRLPEVLRAVKSGGTVYVVEGEKDANRLEDLGLTATTCPMGAGKWRNSYSEVLRGANVVILEDADKAGRDHAGQVARGLHGKAAMLKVLDLPGLPQKGDVSDWLDAGGTASELKRMTEEASEWIPAPESGEPAATGDKPKTFTAAELMEMELPPVRWIVPDILPEGVALLAGKPKMGKSWMAYGLGIAVASGGTALGTKPVERGEVLYLALEDNKRRLLKRLNKLLAGDTAPAGLEMATEWPRLDKGGAEAIDAWLRDHPDAGLVVIDTLKKIRGRTNGQGRIYDLDYEALEPLLPVAAEHNVAILVVHHLRKMDADDPMDAISGSTGLTGGVDGMLVLKRDRGRGDAYLHVDGRDIEEPAELALTWNADVASWTLAGDAEEYRLSQERAEALRVLNKAAEPMSPTEVAHTLDKSVGSVKKLLWQMSRDGQVKSDGGKYSPYEDGNYGNPGNPE